MWAPQLASHWQMFSLNSLRGLRTCTLRPCSWGGSEAGGSAFSRSISTEKLLPSPGSLVTSIVLPMSSASLAQMDRPMPAPRMV
ncbi:hypothetical protein D9M70_644170 [compost metagenome]